MNDATNKEYLPAERQDAILSLLTRQSVVKVPELAQLLHTTPITVRRDLAQLAEAGLLRRVRGGAMSLNACEQAELPTEESTNEPSAQQEAPDDDSIGLLFPEPSFLWPKVVDEIRMQARQHHLNVVPRETSYGTTSEVEQLNDLAAIPGMRGLIIAPTPSEQLESASWNWIQESPLPIVVVERSHPACAKGFFADSVNTNHPAGAWKAYWHFADNGHTRVAAAFSNSPTSSLISKGWQSAVESGSAIDCPFICTDVQPYNTKEVNAVVEKIIESHVSGIFVHSDYLAIAIAQSLTQHGLKVPDDVSMISVDGFASLSSRPLTVLKSSPQTLGRASLQLLLWRLSDPDALTQHVSFDPQLIDNGSVRNLNA